MCSIDFNSMDRVWKKKKYKTGTNVFVINIKVVFRLLYYIETNKFIGFNCYKIGIENLDRTTVSRQFYSRSLIIYSYFKEHLSEIKTKAATYKLSCNKINA